MNDITHKIDPFPRNRKKKRGVTNNYETSTKNYVSLILHFSAVYIYRNFDYLDILENRIPLNNGLGGLKGVERYITINKLITSTKNLRNGFYFFFVEVH